jgi:AcrR family transcriptional regulator
VLLRSEASAIEQEPQQATGYDCNPSRAHLSKARVTRLTVCNHFGLRRVLLEAVFDERAARGGLHRIAEVMAGSDPQADLLRIIEIICDFWNFDPGTLRLLHAAGANDPEFEACLRERNERRRHVLSVLVHRIAGSRRLTPQTEDDLTDVLFALTSFHFVTQLTTEERTKCLRAISFRTLPWMLWVGLCEDDRCVCACTGGLLRVLIVQNASAAAIDGLVPSAKWRCVAINSTVVSFFCLETLVMGTLAVRGESGMPKSAVRDSCGP